MKNFYYLIQRKADGKKFIAHGNKKECSIGLSYLFEFVGDDYPYAVKTPYGLIKNVSSDHGIHRWEHLAEVRYNELIKEA